MKRKLSCKFVFTFFLIFTPLLIFADIDKNEGIFFFLSEKEYPRWKIGHKQDLKNETVQEYIPINQTLDNWKEMLTIYVTQGKVIDFQTFKEKFIQVLKTTAPDAKINEQLLFSKINEICFFWEIKPPHIEAQKGWIKWIKGKSLYNIQYIVKEGTKPRLECIKAVKDAWIVKGEKNISEYKKKNSVF